MHTPIVSIVIPVFNGQDTIERTVSSVLSQTFSDFELIIIDDGCTDKTLRIVNHFSDSRLKVYSYPNAGLSASRNRGIRIASGAFISFLDADDVWTDTKLADQLSALQEHSSASIAYSWTNYIDENDNFIQSGSHLTFNGNIFENLLVSNAVESGANVLVKRTVLEQVGFFDETLKAAEDWDMWLRLSSQYEFVCVPKVQILYRRTNSMSSNVVRQETECVKVLERACASRPEETAFLRQKSLANLYRYLTFKALEGAPGRQKGIESARCLLQAVRYNPSLLKNVRLVLSVVLKISAVVLLPSSQSEPFLNRKRATS